MSTVAVVGVTLFAALAGGLVGFLVARVHGRNGGGQLEGALGPLEAALQRFDIHVRELERRRERAYGGLEAQLELLRDEHGRLRQETGRLAAALQAPTVRGRWGELQLRRAVELAGMSRHCDFVEQMTLRDGDGRFRPDLVVRLPGGRSVVIDAKAPLDGYLGAASAEDAQERREALQRHARQVRDHATQLGSRTYWQRLDSTPEFVVLFLPGEVFFSAALEADPSLLEDAAGRKVVLATPTTLIALLRAVAYGWQESRAAEDARRTAALGRELHRRLVTFLGHLEAVGKGLDRSVRAYNQTVGSLEGRVLVTARRLAELASDGEDQLGSNPVGTAVRKVAEGA